MMDEWSEINDVDPTTISERSTRLVWWKCKTCGHEWKAVVKTKAKGTKCPECRHKEAEEHYRKLIQKRNDRRRLRYQKQTDLFDAQLSANGIEYLKNYDDITGIPLQYYIPAKRIAVEFMMRDIKTEYYYRSERLKNELCLRNNIKMIRVLSKNTTEYDNCLCITKTEDSLECLEEIIDLIMDLICVNERNDNS